MPVLTYNLDKIVEQAERLQQVRRSELVPGDIVMVYTRNSQYILKVLDGQHYLVSGGWFDNEGLSPMKTTVMGCSWGGSILKVDIVAACGLCLEFGNHLTTSSIQRIVVIKHMENN